MQSNIVSNISKDVYLTRIKKLAMVYLVRTTRANSHHGWPVALYLKNHHGSVQRI